ncbi:hypothetical protein LSH36_135g05067 [Paralvinella palmiformis]|uniref:Large ribosomal subunit protein uL23m n=1 Tax=Paralvinella palmiformis TaxID=53620 RepID=A0AAD9JWF9_9ANNE|nr:hypothetical protein LSH36_135g05067 [Paralvinella palmiformis]
MLLGTGCLGPLWQRHIPKYPLYVKGNPQLRVFLPLFWMKMIRPKHKIPEDHVCFEVHPQMTVFDIENYLKKIYDVNVLAVRTRLVKGKEMEVFGPAGIRDDNKRIAFVQLEEKFEIPDMFTEHPSADQKSMEQYDTMQKDHKKAFKKTWPFSDVSPWFR